LHLPSWTKGKIKRATAPMNMIKEKITRRPNLSKHNENRYENSEMSKKTLFVGILYFCILRKECTDSIFKLKKRYQRKMANYGILNGCKYKRDQNELWALNNDEKSVGLNQ